MFMFFLSFSFSISFFCALWCSIYMYMYISDFFMYIQCRLLQLEIVLHPADEGQKPETAV